MLDNSTKNTDKVLSNTDLSKVVKITLRITYWEQGFFNFPKRQLPLLPTQETKITLRLGNDDDCIVEGKFAYANSNKQPRIFGYEKLKLWFQSNYKIGDIVEVEILQCNDYRIT